MKVLVADYGLNVWYGDIYDYEDRLAMLKELGYDGLERLHAATEAEVLHTAALARRMGMGFATCESPRPADSLQWTAALGMRYIWSASNAPDLDAFCRQTNAQIAAAKKYGVAVALHNHLGSAVETWAQLEEYMHRCPESALILDTGHLAGAGGDALLAVERYFDRLVMVHLKDYVLTDAGNPNWWQRLRFCELGGGEMGELNALVIRKLLEKGYAGPIAVEHDTHLRDPRPDLKSSREYIRRAGV